MGSTETNRYQAWCLSQAGGALGSCFWPLSNPHTCGGDNASFHFTVPSESHLRGPGSCQALGTVQTAPVLGQEVTAPGRRCSWSLAAERHPGLDSSPAGGM
jgi:hypothetical protein